MNKGIWVIVAIAAFSVGTFVGTMAPSIPVADAVKDDTQQILNRLDRVLNLLTHANARLDSINAGFSEPPEPDKPSFQVALDSIIFEATNTIATANEIKGKLGP